MKNELVVRSIRWDITDTCNLSCTHCYTLEHTCPDLDFDKVTAIISKVMPYGLQEINFSGREPTLHKDFCRIVQWCSDQGLLVNVTTNGTAIPTEEYDSLIAAPLNMLVFSLDGSEAHVHDGIRGHNTFEKTIHSITHCVETVQQRGTNQKIGVSFTLQQGNYAGVEKIVDLCAMLHIDLLAINPVSLCGAAEKERNLYISPDTILQCWQAIGKRYKETDYGFEMYLGTFPMEAKWLNTLYSIDLPVIHTGCSAGKTLYIDPQGRALPCYMLPAMANVVPGIESYMKYWDVLREPWACAVERFYPFVEFTRNYTHGRDPGCRDCPDHAVCRRCPLIALSDHDAIIRCQKARKKLEAMKIPNSSEAIPYIKPYISWKIQGNRLLLHVNNGDYLAKRTFELDNLGVQIWHGITGTHSITEIAHLITKQSNEVSHEDISEYCSDLIEYLWKDGVLELRG